MTVEQVLLVHNLLFNCRLERPVEASVSVELNNDNLGVVVCRMFPEAVPSPQGVQRIKRIIRKIKIKNDLKNS